MKKKLFKFGAFLAALLTASVAVAQSNQSEAVADIPFTFIVANHSFAAGRYTFKPVNQTLLRIFSSDNEGIVVLVDKAAETVAPDDAGKMIFHRYGESFFLREVWAPASWSGRKVIESPAETQLRRKKHTSPLHSQPIRLAIAQQLFGTAGQAGEAHSH
jgi:hypothetical protein